MTEIVAHPAMPNKIPQRIPRQNRIDHQLQIGAKLHWRAAEEEARCAA
jgi:hypothetical protein